MDEDQNFDQEYQLSDAEAQMMDVSDEEFAALEQQMFGDSPSDGGEAPSTEESTEEDDDTQDTDEAEETDDEPEDDADGESGEAGSEDDADESDDAADAGADGSEETDVDEEDSEGEEDDKPADEPDYKATHEALFQPFKANGKEIQIDSVEDARQLMQMGANYSKKMAALKPNLKTMKLLERSGLLSDEKINYLIDLHSGKEEAIKKLVKDSGIDPLDMNLEEGNEYRPSARNVDDRELALDDVLDSLEGSEHRQRILHEVRTEWDAPSKEIVGNHPGVLSIINDHMASGIYDRIVSEVEKQQMLGRMTGKPFLEAYREVGDAMHEAGAFNDTAQSPEGNAAAKPPVTPPKPDPAKAKEEAKRKSKKRAAGSTRKAPSKSGPPADFNPLALADDELDKLMTKYI